MYRVCADVNDVEVKSVLLEEDFDLHVDAIRNSIEPQTKIIFLCSSNNPTGNVLSRNRVIDLIKWFNGVVVIDEAYIDFSGDEGFINELSTFSNLAVLQTFSKAWGLAGLRVGMCFADPVIINTLSKIKYPYNVSSESQRLVLKHVSNTDAYKNMINSIVNERTRMRQALQCLMFVNHVYPSAANFLLVKVENSTRLYDQLLEHGVAVRNRTKLPRCENSLRITIGTEKENNRLLEILNAL
jgi:histidinol-phosphate aminotransferase